MIRGAPGVRRANYRAPGSAPENVAGTSVLVTIDEGAEHGRGRQRDGNPAMTGGGQRIRNRGVLTVARAGADGLAGAPKPGGTFALVDASGDETSVVWSVLGSPMDQEGLWRVDVSLDKGAAR